MDGVNIRASGPDNFETADVVDPCVDLLAESLWPEKVESL